MRHGIDDIVEGVPLIERVRHETRRRHLSVLSVTALTPNMIRITLGGDDLAGFQSLSAGDHIKLFVPDNAGGLTMRDYTPRRYDAENRILVIDFAIHDAGPATQWASNARPGDQVQIGGPRGSQIVRGPIRKWLLIGDETALPSIGRRIEEMAPGTQVTSVVAILGPLDEQRFDTQAAHTAHWVHRESSIDAEPMIRCLHDIPIEPGTFVWIAAESSVARAVRAYLLEQRQFPLPWLRASGYWMMGKADTTDKLD